MLESQQKKELIALLQEKKATMAQLKQELNAIHTNKEELFRKKEELNSKIAVLIASIKQSRDARNSITSQVLEEKVKRDELNKKIKEKAKEVQKVHGEPKKARESSSKLVFTIKKLEEKFETEVLSFSKEQLLMKQLKDLKAQAKIAKAEEAQWEKENESFKDIRELKTKADALHKNVQEIAQASQQIHESVIASSKEIGNLRKEERDIFQEFINKKNAFSEKNAELKVLQGELAEIQKKLDEDSTRHMETHQKSMKEELSRAADMVRDKMKRGAKLTTEDILAIQEAEKNEEV